MRENCRPYLLKARYGIEREAQRIGPDGRLALTPHPQACSNPEHPYIQRDFAETQIELITPVAHTTKELFDYLAAIHETAIRTMDKEEMLWPLSMPPVLPEEEMAIPIANLERPADVLYRRHLAQTYGRRKQMISGIHYNFEYSEQLLRVLFGNQSEITDFCAFKTEIYLTAAQNYLHFQWLLTYFYGASPLAETNFFEEAPFTDPVRSIRNSAYGYSNNKAVKVSYQNLEAYGNDLESLVNQGQLLEEKEFYSSVRFRGGAKAAELKEKGIRYMELRNIDTNPFEAYGIGQDQVEFINLLMVYLLTLDMGDQGTDEWVEAGNSRNREVALEDPLAPTKFKADALAFLEEMENWLHSVGLNVSDRIFPDLRKALEFPAETLAARLVLEAKKSSQEGFALKLAQQYHDQAWAHPYQLAGFTDMELSTQILMFDAIQKGVSVEVIDRQDQFLKLEYQGQVEYVKNGNMTSKDTYVSPLIMANKTVTKKILEREGFRVPAGEEFTDMASALAAFEAYAAGGFVVKPKSTNFGLGISIFKEAASREDYQKALEIAFAEDRAVLVEEFFPGTEYRFFVLKDQVLAILLRVPANVVGDGRSTVAQLVDVKNQDPLRGTDHRTPLELIQQGELEALMLKAQGYDFNSVPPKGEVVYLRENSNISTGGDSIDVTDEFGDDYKQIAIEAVAGLGANISGIDLIIENKKKPASAKNAYGIIEANFNPSMYMHIYPFKGKSRRVTAKILNYLFNL